MKIVICGSMSASKRMVELKKSLLKMGHKVILPKNTDKYASGKLSAENN